MRYPEIDPPHQVVLRRRNACVEESQVVAINLVAGVSQEIQQRVLENEKGTRGDVTVWPTKVSQESGRGSAYPAVRLL